MNPSDKLTQEKAMTAKSKKRRGPYRTSPAVNKKSLLVDEVLLADTSDGVSMDNEDVILPDAEEEEFLASLENDDADFDEFILDNFANDSTDTSDSDNEPINDTDGEDPVIFTGSRLRLSIFMLVIMSYVTRFHVSDLQLNFLLMMFGMVFPKNHVMKDTLYKFRKYFLQFKMPMIRHKICSNCFSHVKDNATCLNTACAANLTSKGATSYFFEMPLIPQLLNFFAKDGFITKIQHRFKRSNNKKRNVKDIYDGNQYLKHVVNGGPLSKKYNLSLTWNTDGCPIFKSSKFSIWPLYFIINELPYNERIRRENMLFGGIWFGYSKPIMGSYLQPCFETLKNLETDGINVNIPGQMPFKCKVYLIAGTADLPAKALVLNSTQFNGSNGCHKCLQKGESFWTGAGGTTHVYPFMANNPKGPERTNRQTIADSRGASISRPINGVKGPNWFSYLKGYDQIKGCGIDYMHGICLGVMKLFTQLWFGSEHSTQPYSIRANIPDINFKLGLIKPTQEIHRIPRNISHIKFWKASEFRTFLLYFSLPVLVGILPHKYFEHFALLSQSTYILLKDSISPEELIRAEAMLTRFVRDFAHLYGSRYMGINVHNLLHLTDSVRELGPLWTHSCFHFEDKNGFLLKLIHGTQSIPNQIMSAIATIQSLPLISQKYLVKGSPADEYIQKLNRNFVNMGKQIDNNTWILGKCLKKVISDEDNKLLCSFLGVFYLPNSYMVFVRLCKMISGHPTVIHSTSYSRVSQRNNKTIMFSVGSMFHFGILEYCVEIKTICSCVLPCACFTSKYLAIVTDINVDGNCNHVRPGTITNNRRVIYVESIIEKCLFITNNDPTSMYVARYPNLYEKE